MRRSIIMFDRQPVADSGRAKDRGVTAQRFYGADRPILDVDERSDPESFEAFFQQERSNVEPIMAAVGATGEPEMRFWRKLEPGDDVGSD